MSLTPKPCKNLLHTFAPDTADTPFPSESFLVHCFLAFINKFFTSSVTSSGLSLCSFLFATIQSIDDYDDNDSDDHLRDLSQTFAPDTADTPFPSESFLVHCFLTFINRCFTSSVISSGLSLRSFWFAAIQSLRIPCNVGTCSMSACASAVCGCWNV